MGNVALSGGFLLHSELDSCGRFTSRNKTADGVVQMLEILVLIVSILVGLGVTGLASVWIWNS